MALHLLLWAGALALALVLAFRSNTLKQSLLFIPSDPKAPLPQPPHNLPHFRPVPLQTIKDATAYRPRVLLALLLFVLASLLLKLVVAPADGWSTYLVGVFAVFLVGMVVGGGTQQILVFLLLVGVPYWFASWMQWGPGTIGLLAGAVVGGSSGILLARNYVTLFQIKKMEAKHSQTFEGKPISSLGVWYRRGFLVFMATIPVMVGLQLVEYWVPSASLQPSTFGGTGTVNLVTYFIIAGGLGLNLVMFAVPLFREMLERTSLSVISEFSTYVVAARKDLMAAEASQAQSETEEVASSEEAISNEEGEADSSKLQGFVPVSETEARVLRNMTMLPSWTIGQSENRIKEHLDVDGAWLSFQQQQSFPILMAVLFLSIQIAVQTLGKFMQAGVVSDVVIRDGFKLSEWLVIGQGVVFVANLAFFLGLVTFWLRLFAISLASKADTEAPAFDPQTLNTELLWAAVRLPDPIFYCVRQGSDPLLIPVHLETFSATPPQDPSSPD
ncbi:MAG: hypothetical protein EP343_34010 [Deltaproteobacteria bacterium]|nr:MAG: hypothetical protein EP343_34010 [Deltaproteobacteria bacterium]